MKTTPHKLMKEVTAFVAALTPAQKAEIRGALVRNSRNSVKDVRKSP